MPLATHAKKRNNKKEKIFKNTSERENLYPAVPGIALLPVHNGNCSGRWSEYISPKVSWTPKGNKLPNFRARKFYEKISCTKKTLPAGKVCTQLFPALRSFRFAMVWVYFGRSTMDAKVQKIGNYLHKKIRNGGICTQLSLALPCFRFARKLSWAMSWVYFDKDIRDAKGKKLPGFQSRKRKARTIFFFFWKK